MPSSPELFVSRSRLAAFVLLATAVVAFSVSGCARVAPYERGRLAHPTMRLVDMAGPVEAHVNVVHEGASGGDIGASSGCGCN